MSNSLILDYSSLLVNSSSSSCLLFSSSCLLFSSYRLLNASFRQPNASSRLFNSSSNLLNSLLLSSRLSSSLCTLCQRASIILYSDFRARWFLQSSSHFIRFSSSSRWRFASYSSFFIQYAPISCSLLLWASSSCRKISK